MKSPILNKSRGFTIVELLVVIVVIGILAAITMVSYTGVTARANKASAQQTASNISSKAEVYFADSTSNRYPASLSELTTAAASTTYYLSGVTFDGTILSSGNLPTAPSEVNFYRCGTDADVPAGPAAIAGIDVITGARIGWWDYSNATPQIAYTDVGKISGAIGANTIGCFITTTVNQAYSGT